MYFWNNSENFVNQEMYSIEEEIEYQKFLIDRELFVEAKSEIQKLIIRLFYRMNKHL